MKKWNKPYTIQKESVKILNVFDRTPLRSLGLHLFDQKYSKNRIMK